MNVLVIAVDTLRWDHLAHNGRKKVLTPNIDRLAQRATRFDRAYIGSFPTVPNRMDCFTGQACFPKYGWEKMPAEYETLTESLKAAGYYTATVADTTNFINANITRGMDEIHVTLQPPPDAPKPEDVPFPVPPENIRQRGKQRQHQLAEMAHFKHERDWWVARTMTRAADWLQDNAAPGRAGRDKWFLWVDTFEVHEVWHTPQYYVDLYDPNYEGLDYDFPNYSYADIYTKKELKHLWAHYAAEVTLTDRWIGHLLDQLDAMNLWETTMVVLTADHGTYLGEHNRTGKHTVAGPDDPWPLFEELTHIPLLVWIPGLKAKRRVTAFAQPADIMPTILAAAGAKGPRMFGQSLAPLMTGERKRIRDVVYSARNLTPTRNLTFNPARLTARTARWTFVAGYGPHAPELYDLVADPGEKRNVARAHRDVVAKLQAGVVAFMREQGAIEEYVAAYEMKP